MNAWIAYPMREVGVRQMNPTRKLMENFPPSVLSQRKMVWAMILGWLIFVAIILVLFAFGEVEAAEISEKISVEEVGNDTGVALAILDNRATERAATLLNCPKEGLRRKMVVWDFTNLAPYIWAVYTCEEQHAKK